MFDTFSSRKLGCNESFFLGLLIEIISKLQYKAVES